MDIKYVIRLQDGRSVFATGVEFTTGPFGESGILADTVNGYTVYHSDTNIARINPWCDTEEL